MTPQHATIIAERLARAIIPELDGRQLYILQPHDDGMVTRAMLGGAMGVYFPRLDLALQAELESRQQWRGEGIAVVVDAERIFSTSAHPADAERCMIGCVLHELAHWLDGDEPATKPVAVYRDMLAAIEQFGTERPAQQWSYSLLSHGESFIRLCCHLWYRACHGGGYCFRPTHLHFGNCYTGLEYLHAPIEYIDALGDELAMFEHLPLRRVAQLPQPPAFTALWDDVLLVRHPAATAA